MHGTIANIVWPCFFVPWMTPKSTRQCVLLRYFWFSTTYEGLLRREHYSSLPLLFQLGASESLIPADASTPFAQDWFGQSLSFVVPITGARRCNPPVRSDALLSSVQKRLFRSWPRASARVPCNEPPVPPLRPVTPTSPPVPPQTHNDRRQTGIPVAVR